MQESKINDSISNFFTQKSISSINLSDKHFEAPAFIPGRPDISIETIITSQNLTSIGIILLTSMLIISAIWYFSPDTIKSNIRALINNPLKRSWESSTNTSGIIVNLILYLNFVFVLSTSVFIIYNRLLPEFFKLNVSISSLYFLFLITTSYIFFRQIFISLTGFIFDNSEMGKVHNKLLNSLEKAVGLIMLPILLFSIYSSSYWFIIISALILLAFQLSRWVFTMALGIRITKFSWFHIILYLCALEIIPFLLIIKLMKTQLILV